MPTRLPITKEEKASIQWATRCAGRSGSPLQAGADALKRIIEARGLDPAVWYLSSSKEGEYLVKD